MDPLSLIINTNLADFYYYRDRHDESLRHARATIEMDPGFFVAHRAAGTVYQLKGQYEEALVEFRRVMELSGDPGYLGDIAYLYAKWGKRDEALKTLEQMKQVAGTGRSVSPYSFAIAYAGLGDKGKALDYLEHCYEIRNADFQYVGLDRFFDDLHSDPRFVDLLRRTGIPQ